MIVVVDMNSTWLEKLKLGHECIQSFIVTLLVAISYYPRHPILQRAVAVHISIRTNVEMTVVLLKGAFRARAGKSHS